MVLVGIPLAASAAGLVLHTPAANSGAIIVSTGSTNTLGYRISVGSNGKVWYAVAGHAGQRSSLARTMTDKFIADLHAAMPLTVLPVARCPKSASFGTSLYVWWHGQRSPDLSCPSGDARARALHDDAMQIATALHLTNVHFRTLPRNEPRRPLPESSP
jgi:hypothetical protein